ncbi:MAG TPA: hypothetical protein VE172_16575 [Stackebrandtia sp.]|jgi:hypothetical protein|nr:hypothetical protein [Stackebrandtia sp.]HZE40418.1 hypothetical protein [Stackebrandtia sp.]
MSTFSRIKNYRQQRADRAAYRAEMARRASNPNDRARLDVMLYTSRLM